MIKGKEREQLQNTKWVGFTTVKLMAINPTREQLNKLLGKEDSEDDKPINYITQDNEGKDRVRLSFWLHDEKRDKYFVHSFNLTNKERTSRDGVKNQFINNTCITAWSDEEETLPTWFKNFTDKEGKVVGKKEWRKALLGEEELSALLRSWLGKMRWSDTNTHVMLDMNDLLNENYTEIRSLIESRYATPFTILLGVRTDENDSEKQYQQVYGKAFLPAGFMKVIEDGKNFTDPYAKRTWDRFEKEVTGEFGFSSYFELEPAKPYDSANDPAVGTGARKDVTPKNAKF
jgi:hypothetical protein